MDGLHYASLNTKGSASLWSNGQMSDAVPFDPTVETKKKYPSKPVAQTLPVLMYESFQKHVSE